MYYIETKIKNKSGQSFFLFEAVKILILQNAMMQKHSRDELVFRGAGFGRVSWIFGVSAIVLGLSFLIWQSGSTVLDCGCSGLCEWEETAFVGQIKPKSRVVFNLTSVQLANVDHRSRSSGFRSHHRCCFVVSNFDDSLQASPTHAATETQLCFPWSSTWYPESRSINLCQTLTAFQRGAENIDVDCSNDSGHLRLTDRHLSIAHGAVCILFLMAGVALLLRPTEQVVVDFKQQTIILSTRRLFNLIHSAQQYPLLLVKTDLNPKVTHLDSSMTINPSAHPSTEQQAYWTSLHWSCVSSRRARYPRFQISLVSHDHHTLTFPITYLDERHVHKALDRLLRSFRAHGLDLAPPPPIEEHRRNKS